MPTIIINGKSCEFTPGQMIIQAANAHAIDIPQYCYHDGLSIVASCRICLAEVWQPNPRNNNALEPIPKLMPTCQTACAPGMVVYTDSPKAIANQKAVMEYLLINHPLDCPVCDQSGECFLQDYSYEYGRAVSRFEENKVKQPKKDLGPGVLLYSDRCIMCTRCVRFTREVTGTGELMVQGRGNKEEIDVFPGVPLDNELAGNVVDLCPVGALLDKDFLFTQRVWFLKDTPSIDGITASGDNIRIDHNDGKVYRVKPRTNPAINKWWITDEVRHGWSHVHSDARLTTPLRKQFGTQVESDWNRAYSDAMAGLKGSLSGGGGGRLAVLISPMLSCEDAYLLARLALELDPRAILGVGFVPVLGKDKTFPPGDPNGFRVYAEKAPNARGVRRVLAALAEHARGASVMEFREFVSAVKGGQCRGVVLTGNYPSDWAAPELLSALDGAFVVLIDTLAGRLSARADVVLPGATWVEKAGSFQNARDILQGFEQAIPPVGLSKPEGQIALDLAAILHGAHAIVGTQTFVVNPGKPGQVADAVTISSPLGALFDAEAVRRQMSGAHPSLAPFNNPDIRPPVASTERTPDMAVVEL